MKFKSQLSVVSLATAVIALVGASKAQAQMINFSNVAPGAPAALGTYTQTFGTETFTVIQTKAVGSVIAASVNQVDTNPNQGNSKPNLSSSTGGASKLSIDVTATTTGSSNPTYFEFNSVDLGLGAVSGNSVSYTIDGYSGPLTAPTLVFTATGVDSHEGSPVIAGQAEYVTYSTSGNVQEDGDIKCSLTNCSGSITGNINGSIDQLVIIFNDPKAGDYLDNIQLPEGGSAWLYLLLAGGVCCSAIFFKRRVQLAA